MRITENVVRQYAALRCPDIEIVRNRDMGTAACFERGIFPPRSRTFGTWRKLLCELIWRANMDDEGFPDGDGITEDLVRYDLTWKKPERRQVNDRLHDREHI